jgi:hypothetical protein
MARKKLVITFLLLVTLQSCHLLFKGYRTTEYGSNRPTQNRFTIGQDPYSLKDDDPIKTDFIYTKTDSVYLKSAITKEKELFVYNTFLRFFSNGRYFESTTKKKYSEALNDYNNLKDGIVGYYKIENKKLSLEYFVVSAHGHESYVKNELKLFNDSIEGYNRLKIEGLTGTPDW